MKTNVLELCVMFCVDHDLCLVSMMNYVLCPSWPMPCVNDICVNVELCDMPEITYLCERWTMWYVGDYIFVWMLNYEIFIYEILSPDLISRCIWLWNYYQYLYVGSCTWNGFLFFITGSWITPLWVACRQHGTRRTGWRVTTLRNFLPHTRPRTPLHLPAAQRVTAWHARLRVDAGVSRGNARARKIRSVVTRQVGWRVPCWWHASLCGVFHSFDFSTHCVIQIFSNHRDISNYHYSIKTVNQKHMN